MIVMKFGGTVLHQETGFLSMVKIIKDSREKSIIVISAFSDVTRSLDSSMKMVLEDNYESSILMIDKVIHYHKSLANTLSIDSSILQKEIQRIESLLKRLLKGISLTGEISAKTRDVFLSQGEELAVIFIQQLLLSKGVSPYVLDARKIIITDNAHGHAKPIEYRIQFNVQEEVIPLFNHHDIMLIAGFIGSNEHGEVTTMGYESSNLTASVLGSLLNADEIQIWTDVAGIRSVDPKLYSKNVPIRSINFALANILANHGSKLLHHWMIDLPMKFNIPVTIRNAYDSNGEYTIINDQESTQIPTIFIVSDSIPLQAQVLLSIITINTNIIQSMYEYCSTQVKHNHIQLSTYITPYLHTMSLDPSLVNEVINRLHTFNEN